MKSQPRLAPGQLPPSDMMTLCCWVFNELQSFTVKIHREQTVHELKKAIVAERPRRFQGIDAADLELWRKIIRSEERKQLKISQLGCALDEAYDIGYYFEEDPPRRNIHIVIRLPDIGKLTERRLLTLPLPSLTYLSDSERSRAPTKSSWARSPTSVADWKKFIRKAKNMSPNDTIPRYDRPILQSYEVSQEADVQDALKGNILKVLSESVGADQIPKENFRRCSPGDRVQGRPDFILLDSNRQLLLAVEVKTKWVLSVSDIVKKYKENLTELEERYTSPISVIDPVRQIFGYMGHNKLQYGVLSTYEKTWFLRRSQTCPGKLFISKAVRSTATDPTLLQCFAYIMSLARDDPECPTPPTSAAPSTDGSIPSSQSDDPKDPTFHPSKGSSSRSGRGGQGRDRGGAGKSGGTSSSNTGKGKQVYVKGKQGVAGNEQSNGVLRLEDFGWDSFNVIDVLGSGRCGTVFEAVLRGENVAYKLCDLWKHPEYEKEMLTEVETYIFLEQLQGRTIPKLKGAGYTAGGFMAIATELAGSPIKVAELSDQERNQIITALSDIHDRGVLHQDIRPENILIQRHRDVFKVRFIDFAFSKGVSNKEEPRKEMAMLRTVLGLPPIIENGKSKKPRLV